MEQIINKICQAMLEEVRNDFFHRWDKGNFWHIKLDSSLPAYARCYKNDKKIVIQSFINNKDEMDNLLIHEITHAVTNDGHGKRWQDRYLKAAKTAEELGRKPLAKLIREEIRMYQKMSPKPNARMIYEQIHDLVWESGCRMSYEEIIMFIGKGNGLYPKEVEKRFKKCRKVFDSALLECKDCYEKEI